MCQSRHLVGPPAPTDVCPYRTSLFDISLLDLDVGGEDRPTIDGYIMLSGDGLGDSPVLPLPTDWQGSEYSSFVQPIPMYNGGKNLDSPGATPPIGIARVGYDCNKNILCVAAYLDQSYFETNNCSVQDSESESWVRFTDNNGYPKLFQSNAAEFNYIKYPGASGTIIGES